MPDTEVLVIDTNQLSRRVLEEELNSHGCKTILASSAKEGLDMASSIDPDIITLDITLDDMSGLDLLGKLKTLGATKSIPAMVVTGFEDPIQKELCLRAGAVEVIYKPFKRGQVASRINNHLSPNGQEDGRNILVVEDSGTIRAITKHLLEKQGHTVVEASDGKEGWDELLFRGQDIDMVVTDINMPNMDGRELVKLIRGDQRFQFTPIIVSTTISEKENVKLVLNMGADDYIVKPFSTEEFVARIESHLRVKSLYEDLRKANKSLSIFNETLEKRVEERTLELKEANLDAIYSLATAAEAKDDDTGDHVRRIQYYSEALAFRLGLPKMDAEEIGYSSIMHDVGKISIPDDILKKPAKLTFEEFEIIKTHPIKGEEILPVKPFFQIARSIARSHHEKWNGKGYPDGLEGEDIPISARIVAVADVFDALTTVRPYKKAWPMDQAMEEMKNSAGNHFDPNIIEIWVELYKEGTLELIHKEWQ